MPRILFESRIKFIAFLLIIPLTCASAIIKKTASAEKKDARVRVIKNSNGTWELLVNNKPYFIKGVVFSPVKIGEDPGSASMRDWMYYDDNNDEINDVAFQSWLDTNANNKKDANEEDIGDFRLLKEMGCNTIRLYHVPSDNPILGDIYKSNSSTALQFGHPVNKELLRKLYKDFGIMVIMGNFVGSWTIGSGASWDEGTDYNNPRHVENIKKSVKAMVLDNKDEPYVLMWLLGNENNIADWSRCNAKAAPKAYAKLIGQLAEMIHKLDPQHPVAVCDGDSFNTLPAYAKYAQEIDILAFNSYRGAFGFGNLWKECKRTFDKPVFISEFGAAAYNINTGEEEDYQLNYINGCWRDIVQNSSRYYEKGKKLSGNSLGAVVFDWIDRWYMDGSPSGHNPGRRYFNSPDNLRHEEWFGIVSMGDGNDWLLRHKRKTYNYLKDIWSRDNFSF